MAPHLLDPQIGRTVQPCAPSNGERNLKPFEVKHRRLNCVTPAGGERLPETNAGSSSIADWCPACNPWLIAIAVILPTFMEVLDTAIASVILPHIAGSLSASTDEATWVLTSYLVANAVVSARQQLVLAASLAAGISCCFASAFSPCHRSSAARRQPGDDSARPHLTGRRRRGAATVVAIDPARKFPSRKTRLGDGAFALGVVVAPVWDRRWGMADRPIHAGVGHSILTSRSEWWHCC